MNLLKRQDVRFPDFVQPTVAELSGIEPGSLVQVSRRSRRFWIEVVAVMNEEIKGLVDSMDITGLEYGTQITLKKENVLMVFYT